jgi:membrane protein YdbS with pleckstrin-like domain
MTNQENVSQTNITFRHIRLSIYILWVLIFLVGLSFLTEFWVIGAGIEVLLLLQLLVVYITHWTEFIILEDHCINMRSGLIIVKNNRVPYTKINNINLTSFGGICDLEIDTGNDTSEIVFKWIEKPESVKQILEQKLQVNNYYQNSNNNPGTNSQDHQKVVDNIEQLKQLMELRSSGVLSEAEFFVQKRKILDDKN